jgi:hypothetical protein
MRTTLFWVITQRVRPVGGPETSVRNYHYSLRNNPEERSSLLLLLLPSLAVQTRIPFVWDTTPSCLGTQANHCPMTRCNIPEELTTKSKILPVNLSEQTIPFHFDRYLTEYQTTLYLVLEFGSLALANQERRLKNVNVIQCLLN